MLRISILPTCVPKKWGVLAPNFAFLDEKFPISFRQPKICEAIAPPLQFAPPATTPLYQTVMHKNEQLTFYNCEQLPITRAVKSIECLVYV